MFVGVCKISISIPGAQSLKEKRSVVQRVKQKVLNQFKILVSEVGALQNYELAELAFASVSSDENFIRDLISKIQTFIESSEGLRIIFDRSEILQYE